LKLEVSQPFLKRTDAPAQFLRKGFYRGTLFIERADVSAFHQLAFRAVIYPSQGQTLGSTDIRASLINSAASSLVQKRASAGSAGSALLEKFRVMTLDIFGFNRKDREVVLTTVRAPQAAPEPLSVRTRQSFHLLIDVFIELIQGVEGGIPSGSFRFSQRSSSALD
jgi:hypothetical protein